MREVGATPCGKCREGMHEQCTGGICRCLADHADDDRIMANFKQLKRAAHPEQEAWVKGGWRRPPIRVTAHVGRPVRTEATEQ